MEKCCKRFIAVLCSIMLVVSSSLPYLPVMASTEDNGEGGIALDETNFPSPDLLNCVKNSGFDSDGDGFLSEEELKKITYICIYINYGYNDGIDGIENLKYLKSLSVSGDYNSIKLDLSKNSRLTVLNCHKIILNEPDFNQNLEYLDCSSTGLGKLDLSQVPNLKELNCSSNGLKELDLSQVPDLKELDCSDTNLKELDLSQVPDLKELDCSFNELEKLDLSQVSGLEKLDCSDNYSLKELDLSQVPDLKELDCSENSLYELDFSKNTLLEFLDCSNDTGGIVWPWHKNKIQKLDFRGKSHLKKLICSYNEYLEEVIFDANNNLEYLECNGCNSEFPMSEIFDFACLLHLKTLYCDSYEYDSNGNVKAFDSLDLSKNVNLDEVSCAAYKSIKINYKAYLSGILSDIVESGIGNNIYMADEKSIIVEDITKPIEVGRKIGVLNITITDSNGNPITPDETGSDDKDTTENGFATPDCEHLFTDYEYGNKVDKKPVVIYGNGAVKTINEKKVNTKQFVAYTDLSPSYNNVLNDKQVVKPSSGKIVVGITMPDADGAVPEVVKNKIVDKEAEKYAKAKFKNGQITVTATGKESGLVYLWIIDTGSKGSYECCPINVQMAPVKMELHNIETDSVDNKPSMKEKEKIKVKVVGIASGSKKTYDCKYTPVVDSKYEQYIKVTPYGDKGDEFVIEAISTKDGKKTKAAVTFLCDKNNKKGKFNITIEPSATE